MRSALLFCAGLALLLVSACGQDAPNSAFVAAPPTGFVHDNGFEGAFHFPETFGSGVAVLDADGDGVRDLYLVQGGRLPLSAAADHHEEREGEPGNVLLLGAGDGSFRPGAAGAAADRGYGMGAIVGDLNGDALADLVVTNIGPDRVFLGTGASNALFAKADDAALDSPHAANWSSAAGLADLNRDGHLDLVLVAYSAWTPELPHACPGPAGDDYCDVKEYPGAADRVLIGDGTGGFSDVTAAWGLDARAERGLGLALADFDADGDVDLYIANDTDPNAYWQNEDGTRFTDRTTLSGAATNMDGRVEAGMGVAIADVDGDARPDIAVTNFSAEPHALYINRGGGRFRESSRAAGIAAASLPKLSFGAVFGDLDHNGHEDLFTASGHVLKNAAARTSTWAWKQPDLLLMGTGPLAFEVREPGTVFSTPRVGRGAALGDLDGDGRLDLAVTHSNAALEIGLNRLELAGGFLGLELRDPSAASNRLAIGAQVTAELNSGRRLVRWLRSGTSYLSQDDLRIHFGLPEGDPLGSVTVLWPDGGSSTHTDLAPGAWHTLTRPVSSFGD